MSGRSATLAATLGSAPPAPNAFRERLAAPGQPVYAVELVPSERRLKQHLQFAAQASGLDVTLMLTDGAGGHVAPPPEPLAATLAQIMDRQPIVTVACKTVSREALLARLAAMNGYGLENVLIVTGDYPRTGGGPFPLDSVQLLLAAGELAAQRVRDGAPAAVTAQPKVGTVDPAPALYLGAALSPFKYLSGDVWGQRLKTWKKWRAGASLFATQIGFDVRKFQEVRHWMAHDGMADVPVLASVYVLHAGTARRLAGGKLPGVYLPPDLEMLATSLTGPTGRALARRRAALLADVLVRGLGYRGVLFCGAEGYDDLAEILDIQSGLAEQDWRESYAEYRRWPRLDLAPAGARELRFAPDDAYYLFPQRDDGLPAGEAEQPAAHLANARPQPVLPGLHQLLFEPGRPGTWLLARGLAAGEAAGLAGAIASLEAAVKAPLLGCEMCGDCRIAYLQFRCPQPSRGCSKGLLNGPCGGATIDGQCEVDSTRACYWRLVVESARGGESGLAQLYHAQPPRNPALRGTSSWLNHVTRRTPSPLSLGAAPAAAARARTAPPES